MNIIDELQKFGFFKEFSLDSDIENTITIPFMDEIEPNNNTNTDISELRDLKIINIAEWKKTLFTNNTENRHYAKGAHGYIYKHKTKKKHCNKKV